MTKEERLYVHQSGNRVGLLTKKGTGAIAFQYFQDQVNIPVSLSLPLREQAYEGNEVYNYFDNLLPDNRKIREKIATAKGAKSTSPFDLLQAIGQDCVGALQFTLEPEPSPREPIYGRVITEKDIATMISQLESFPLGMNPDEIEFRISIAGVQEKTSLLWHEDAWHIPLGATPSTHILKPPMGQLHNGIDLTTSVQNEWLCLQICKFFRLPTAAANIQTFTNQICLVVERFDRLWKRKELERKPQEDLCQALGIPSHLKYEADHRNSDYERPDANTILGLLNQSDRRRQDREQFFRALVAFYLLAATDGHGKNFSLFLTPTQFKMTPIYDVMSVYPALEKKQIEKKQVKLAMSLGDRRHYKHSEICMRHFFQTAKRNALPRKIAKDILDELIEQSFHLEESITLPSKFPEFVAKAIFSGCIEAAKHLQET